MKRHHNTLYVTTQGTYLASERDTLVVRHGQETKLRLPLHMLEGVVCFGQVSASPFLLARCAERDVGVSFLTEHGRFLARVVGPCSGNVLLRREQYRRADAPQAVADVARSFVLAKVANARVVLQRAMRDRPGNDGAVDLDAAVKGLARCAAQLPRAEHVDSIRGLEGDAARQYFGVFRHLIAHQRESFGFERRSRRPPLDRMNALLSFLYTLLLHDAMSALETVGLDPQVGFLHRDRPGRPGLALDLMEELRAAIADRVALTLVNRLQVKPSGFEECETGGVVMNDATRKVVLQAYQERKSTEIRHGFLNEQTTVGMLVHLQALLLARYLRGDLDAYPSFVAK